jgi:hypothetical protein
MINFLLSTPAKILGGSATMCGGNCPPPAKPEDGSVLATGEAETTGPRTYFTNLPLPATIEYCEIISYRSPLGPAHEKKDFKEQSLCLTSDGTRGGILLKMVGIYKESVR